MKNEITIEEFCSRHFACEEGKKWALYNCSTMKEAWNRARPEWVIWIATRYGVLNDRDLRLFAVYCARSCQKPNADPRLIAAIDCAERFAKGEVTNEELSAAESAAESAAWSVAESAAWSARSAAESAAWSARSVAESAARSVAWSAQADWLRNNTIPNFEI